MEEGIEAGRQPEVPEEMELCAQQGKAFLEWHIPVCDAVEEQRILNGRVLRDIPIRGRRR